MVFFITLILAFLALVAGLNSGIRVWEWLP